MNANSSFFSPAQGWITGGIGAIRGRIGMMVDRFGTKVDAIGVMARRFGVMVDRFGAKAGGSCSVQGLLVSLLTLTLSIPALAQTPLIRVAQETLTGSTGNRDFDQNVVGVVRSIDRSTRTPCSVYNYGSDVYRGDLLGANGTGLTIQRAHIIFAQCAASSDAESCTPYPEPSCSPFTTGTSLFVLFDDDVSGNGNGSAKTVTRVVNSSAACMALFDGDAGVNGRDRLTITQIPGGRVFGATNTWDNLNSDGYAIAQLNGPWVIEFKFADYAGSNPNYDVIDGLTSWSAYSADAPTPAGPPFALALATVSTGVGQRTAQFRPLGTCEVVLWPSQLGNCPGTFHATANGTGPFTYEWRHDGVPIPGATASTLLIPDASPQNLGNYVVVVSSPCGTSTSNVGRVVRCIADIDDGNGTGLCDGGVTIDDLLYYIRLYEAGDIRADIDDGSGTGTPDGGVTIDDLLYFIRRFEEGC